MAIGNLRHFIFAAVATGIMTLPAFSGDFPFRQNVTLKVGQSTILKGVRPRNCDDRAPTWGEVRNRLPRPKTGKYSDGGAGTVISDSCGKRVKARGIKFTATKQGTESLNILNDRVNITVK